MAWRSMENPHLLLDDVPATKHGIRLATLDSVRMRVAGAQSSIFGHGKVACCLSTLRPTLTSLLVQRWFSA